MGQIRSNWVKNSILVPEGSEVDYEEEPAYTLESLFSDVGGAAGLALGMSLATFFGALEYLMYRYWTNHKHHKILSK